MIERMKILHQRISEMNLRQAVELRDHNRVTDLYIEYGKICLKFERELLDVMNGNG